jgi:HSP20 family protein
LKTRKSLIINDKMPLKIWQIICSVSGTKEKTMKLIKTNYQQPLIGINPYNWDMDSFWDRVFSPTANGSVWQPLLTLHEEGDSYRIRVETPGFKREELKVEIENRKVAISGEMDRDGIKRSFYKSFVLPQGEGDEGMKATYENGVLEITLPKKDEVKTRTLAIE